MLRGDVFFRYRHATRCLHRWSRCNFYIIYIYAYWRLAVLAGPYWIFFILDRWSVQVFDSKDIIRMGMGEAEDHRFWVLQFLLWIPSYPSCMWYPRLFKVDGFKAKGTLMGHHGIFGSWISYKLLSPIVMFSGLYPPVVWHSYGKWPLIIAFWIKHDHFLLLC